MERTTKSVFLLLGAMNAAFFGLLASFAINFGYDLRIVSMATAFFLSAILLIRAPYSKKHMDSHPVSALRFVISSFFCFALYVIGVEQRRDSSNVADPIGAGLYFSIILITFTITLLVLMKALRKNTIASLPT